MVSDAYNTNWKEGLLSADIANPMLSRTRLALNNSPPPAHSFYVSTRYGPATAIDRTLKNEDARSLICEMHCHITVIIAAYAVGLNAITGDEK